MTGKGEFRPLVTVVVPAYNAARTVGACVEACLNQEYPAVEVIVADDGSTDDTERIVERYPVRYLRHDHAGPASARNRGWHAATGEVICFTDSDCVPPPDWMSKLVGEYTSEEIAGVGGTYDIVDADNLLAACIHEEIVLRHVGMPRYVNFLGSFNVSYRRAVLEEVSGFDESYRMASGEDNDLAYRIIRRGYKLVFTREARVAHYHPSNLWRYLRHQFWHGYWRMKLYRHHPDMSRGDVYGGWLDFVQPPLCVGTLALMPLALIWPVLWGLVGLLALFDLVLQFPNTARVVGRTGALKYWTLASITWLRGYVRGLGMLMGVWDFYIRRRDG
jgi:glycosyltransferase involved in cell wall biosynthesis